jgi:hypothetical protein
VPTWITAISGVKLLRKSGVEEVALAAGLDEHPLALPHFYKAHDQRARGWRLGGARRG